MIFNIINKLLLLVIVISGVRASYKEDITLTSKEKAALDKFKSLIIPKIPVSSYIQNYTKDDLYFIRWVRAKSLDVGTSERAFLNHLKWREELQVDSILDEDWTEFEEDFPIFVDTADKSGRPTMELWYSDWDVRAAALTGKSRQFHRWLARNLEIFTRRIYSARAAGKEISHGVMICAIEDFNLVRHACPICLPLYVSTLIMLDTHYPGLAQEAFAIDVPPTFQVILRLVQALIPDAAKILKIFRTKEEGLKALEQRFDSNQRSVRFGGTLIRNSVA